MGRGSRFLESSVTEEEDSYRYRVEWDDIITVDYDCVERRVKTEHHGSGSRDVLVLIMHGMPLMIVEMTLVLLG